ncbi:hypothetical protein CPAV1605_988 [seawater metagenome]|uniref:mRNA capping enzyme adenylation domain-containing protein n=1 Tax=seawater metagenome TaxID=1561972 RepID=A0A5E8CIQ2_9ZZZZ
MVYKNISFGCDNAQMINDIKTKKKLMDFLFNTINLSNYRYSFLNNYNRLKYLKENEHYVSPNFHGYNYLFIFTSVNGTNMAVMIDRRKLKYNQDHIDYNKLSCIKVDMKISKKMYNGTILDGKFIRSNNEYIFLIQDVYYLLGNSMLDTELSKKINILDSTINTYFANNPCHNFNIKINKLYEYKDLDMMINKVMKGCKLLTNGIIFFSKYSGNSIIYLDKKEESSTNTKVQIVESGETVDMNTTLKPDRLNDIIMNMKDYLHGRKYGYMVEESDKMVQLEIRKTKIPDVFDIYLKKEDDKLEKNGIALIPNMKTSHLCQNLFRNSDKEVMVCQYYSKYKKWIPLRKASNDKIDNEYKIKKVMKAYK